MSAGLNERATRPEPVAPHGDTSNRFVSLVELQTIPMANGILGVAEVSKHIGFPVHRAYYIRDVPAGESRGAHGHKALRQCFLCLRGSVRLSITKAGRTETVDLARPSQAAVVAAGCWRDLSDFSDDSVVIVLASEEYEEADYIRDFSDFVRWEAGDEPVTAVPYLDLRRTSEALGPEMELAIRRVMKSGAPDRGAGSRRLRGALRGLLRSRTDGGAGKRPRRPDHRTARLGYRPRR